MKGGPGDGMFWKQPEAGEKASLQISNPTPAHADMQAGHPQTVSLTQSNDPVTFRSLGGSRRECLWDPGSGAAAVPCGPGPRPRSHYPVGAPAVPCKVIALAPRDPPPLPPLLRHLHSCPPQKTPPRGHHPPLHPLLSAGQVCPVTAQPQGEPVMGSTARGQSVVCGAESRCAGPRPSLSVPARLCLGYHVRDARPCTPPRTHCVSAAPGHRPAHLLVQPQQGYLPPGSCPPTNTRQKNPSVTHFPSGYCAFLFPFPGNLSASCQHSLSPIPLPFPLQGCPASSAAPSSRPHLGFLPRLHG